MGYLVDERMFKLEEEVTQHGEGFSRSTATGREEGGRAGAKWTEGEGLTPLLR